MPQQCDLNVFLKVIQCCLFCFEEKYQCAVICLLSVCYLSRISPTGGLLMCVCYCQVITASQTTTGVRTIRVLRARTALTLVRMRKCPAADRTPAASVRKEPKKTEKNVYVSTAYLTLLNCHPFRMLPGHYVFVKLA